MSFWNLLCGAVMLDMVCKWFSPKRETPSLPHQPSCGCADNSALDACIKELEWEIRESEKRIAEYRKIIGDRSPLGLNDCDADELHDRIDELEEQLDSCDIMSDCYNGIQNEIDMLQDRLDHMEDMDFDSRDAW